MAQSFCNTNHILVGLGGTGGKILKAFKMRMFEEFPDAAERDKQPVALLYIDSTDEMMGIGRPDFRVMGMDASFTQNEFLNIKAVDVVQILDHIDNYPALKGVVDNAAAVKTAIGNLGAAAGQKRRAGRLLFAANAVAYVNALRDAFARCDAISHNSEYPLNIHIFAGLNGGTGSGSIIDAIVQARKTFPESVISVYAMMPEMNLPKSNMDQGRYYQNGYAAMNELNALQAGRFFPADVTSAGHKAKMFSDKAGGVANGLTIYSNVNENGLTINSLQELPKIVSDFVYSRIFLINSTDEINNDIIRAYSYENMDDFRFEYDETKNADSQGQIPIARTKKINSFGIKRVMYPELRILKHITYTVGEKILLQFKYNNWRENLGYVDEEQNKDYRDLYFNDTNLATWMIDDEHLTLEKMILQADIEKKYQSFKEFWHDKMLNYSDEAKQAENPLNELDNILADFYARSFRAKMGVVEFFATKERAIPEMAREIRRTIEHELFGKWKDGEFSIIELQKVSKLLGEHLTEKKKDLDEQIKKAEQKLHDIDEDRAANLDDWANKSFLKKKVFGGDNDSFTEQQNILVALYTQKTLLEGLAFARKLLSKLFLEWGKLDADISAFGQKINNAIEETERLIAAQKKVNKGLEDMKGAIIEVSEEETMTEFEVELSLDKTDMPNIARQIRESILPQAEFTNFGNLANELTVDIIRDAFDLKLSEVVKTKHAEKADSDKKVLGLNILTQLQQKLTTDEQIQRFALDIVKQSGVYLKLNTDQMQLHVRNNEGNLSPTNPASVNKKVIFVSIPSPEKNESLKVFADKLEKAFRQSFAQGAAQTQLVINKKSPRQNELSIITVQYCYPMRAISWMEPYKERYENFLNTGNQNTDAQNAILLHSEGNGKDLPSLFVVENAAQIAEAAQATAAPTAGSVPPPPGATPPPPPGTIPPPPVAEPQVQMHLFIGGQQYGPYDYQMLKQFKTNGQLTADTLVWQAGMAAWTKAGEVQDLKALFAPAPPVPGMPPMPGVPPTPGMPPMPPMM